LRHIELFDDSSLGSIASYFGRSHRELATSALDRLPADRRDAWIVASASGMADFDANAAVEWIARFRGQPVHETALRRIVSTVGRNEPGSARQIVAQHVTDPELRRQLEAQLAPRPGR
jgi:hypothetical protein